MSDGRRADIIKCRAIQPSIRDHAHYASYLWVKSLQGYFLLRQHFIEGQATEWRVIREYLVDDDNPDFFDQAEQVLIDELERQDFRSDVEVTIAESDASRVVSSVSEAEPTVNSPDPL